MTVFDKARELGQAIIDSQQYKDLKAAEEAQEHSEEAMALLSEYNEFNKNLADEMSKGEVSKERMEKIREEMQKKYDELMENQVIYTYVTARNEFENMVNQVNAIIGYFVKGEAEEGGCSGSCSTCGGCH